MMRSPRWTGAVAALLCAAAVAVADDRAARAPRARLRGGRREEDQAAAEPEAAPAVEHAPRTAPLGAVHVPEREDSLVAREVRRFHPDVVLRQYRGDSVERSSGEVVVIYADDAHRPGVIASHVRGRRLVVVYLRSMERLLGVDRGSPHFKIALGRAIAHEIEHASRPTGEHDADGWFRACLTREEMLQVGWSGR